MITNAMTIDVEDYFQVEAFSDRIAPEDWENYPLRVEIGCGRILELLDKHQTKATFFVLGWLAQRRGRLVKSIAEAGHEIASHGFSHRMITRQSADEFRRDVRKSKHILEDLTGRPVIGYRAPTFSLVEDTKWAIDILSEEGFRYDSSIFPVRHDRYGIPDAPRTIHETTGPGGETLLEFPPLTRRRWGRNIPFGGGGYLRLFPVNWFISAIQRFNGEGHPAMIYVHPWELDPDHPILPGGPLKRWRHRVNLARTADKLDTLLSKLPFSTAAEVLRIDR